MHKVDPNSPDNHDCVQDHPIFGSMADADMFELSDAAADKLHPVSFRGWAEQHILRRYRTASQLIANIPQRLLTFHLCCKYCTSLYEAKVGDAGSRISSLSWYRCDVCHFTLAPPPFDFPCVCYMNSAPLLSTSSLSEVRSRLFSDCLPFSYGRLEHKGGEN